MAFYSFQTTESYIKTQWLAIIKKVEAATFNPTSRLPGTTHEHTVEN